MSIGQQYTHQNRRLAGHTIKSIGFYHDVKKSPEVNLMSLCKWAMNCPPLNIINYTLTTHTYHASLHLSCAEVTITFVTALVQSVVGHGIFYGAVVFMGMGAVGKSA